MSADYIRATCRIDTAVRAPVAVYTNSQGRSWRVAEGIECGMVGVNESGQGREG
jgi:acyl-CoA reductase-like NAD-dependent aldehyde dehydrogenase